MSLSKHLVSWAYWLEEQKGYVKTKAWVNDVLNNSGSLKKGIFDFFMIFLVLSTVSILIYEIKHPVPQWLIDYEIIAVFIFLIEWLGRLWVSSDIHEDIIEYHEHQLNLGFPLEGKKFFSIIVVEKLKFIFSPLSIIDLLAILPAYRPLRILRIFMLFRLFKIIRYTQSLNSFFRVFIEKRFEFMVLFMLSIFVVFIASTVMYIFEGIGNNPNIHTYFDAIYWSIVTISSLGYGDVTPVTVTGKVLTVLLVGGGFAVIVFATSILTSALSEKLVLLQENRVRAEASRLKDVVIIFGFGRMGVRLAEELWKTKQRFIVVDSAPEQIELAKSKNYLAYQSDVAKYETLRDVVFRNQVSTAVAITSSDAANLSVLLGIKANKPGVNVIVRANDKANIKKFEIAGADHVIFPYKTVGEVATEYVGSPAAFDAIDNILIEKEGIIMDEVAVPPKSALIGQPLSALEIDTLRITLVGLFEHSSEKFMFNPSPEEYLIRGDDVLIVIGMKEQIAVLHHRLGKVS